MWNYFLKRWFFLGGLVGVAFAIYLPLQARNVFDPMETRYVAGTALFFMSLSLATRQLLESVRRPGPFLAALAMSWLLAPLLAWAVASVALPEKFRVGMIVVMTVPCTMASAAVWTGMGGGNQAVALLMTMVTNSLVFLGTAGWLVVLTGREVSLSPAELMSNLVVYVVVPIVAAQSIRSVSAVGKQVDRIKGGISVLCRVLILLIIVKSAVQASTELARQGNGPEAWNVGELVLVGLVCAGIHLVLLFAGYGIGLRLFSRADAVAIAISGSQKTLPVAALIVNEYYPQAALAIVPVLFYHVIQLILDTYFVEQVAPPHAHALEPPEEVLTT
jgi:sodium/bile acid cotransporter 7